MTAVGNAKVSTAQSKFGGSSYLGDGTGDYLTVGTQTLGNFGSGDFTVECWVRSNSPNNYLTIMSHGWNFSNTNKSWWLYQDISNKIGFRFYNGTTDIDLQTSNTITTAWHHIAVVGTSSTIKIYMDGVERASVSRSTIASNTYNSWIGAMDTGYNSWNGYIDEFRISNSARYTAGFTPATASFNNDANTTLLLHMDGTNNSTTFTDDIAPPPKATGGTVSDINVGGINYRTHRFITTGNSTFTVNEPLSVDILLVGGGGGGGNGANTNPPAGGGGGGGRVITQFAVPVTAGNYTLVVGAGGTSEVPGTAANNGADSTGLTYTALGGGRGSTPTVAVAIGGTDRNAGGGAGGGGTTWSNSVSGYRNGGSGSHIYGNGGGGAGDGANGGGGGSSTAGAGGAGTSVSGFNASAVTYGGGGGGGSQGNGNRAAGGAGGGGSGADGGSSGIAYGGSGTDGFGGGGGGGGESASGGGNGGSGIVIIRYAL
jgi:hypothetical protein